MNVYEITFITKEEKNDSLAKTIESLNGKIIQEKPLGRRKFAYPIKKETAGYYNTIIFDFDNQQLSQLNNSLKLNGDLIRYLIVRPEKTPATGELGKPLARVKLPKTLPEKEVKEAVEEIVAPFESEEAKEEVKKSKKTLAIKEKEAIKVQEKETKTSRTPITKTNKEAISEEERMATLEKKLGELLKD